MSTHNLSTRNQSFEQIKKRLFFSLLSFLLLVSAHAQQALEFDQLQANKVEYNKKKGKLRVLPDPESPSSFYATFYFDGGDSLHCRFSAVGDIRKIKIASLEKLEKNKQIAKDGVLKAKRDKQYIETPYVMGRKHGTAFTYKEDSLFLKSIYHNNKTTRQEVYYPNGLLRAEIVPGQPYKYMAFKKEIEKETEDIVEYYKTGQIKRKETWVKNGIVLQQQHYTPEGKDTLFALPFMRMATFPGGEDVMMAYIAKNVKYPEKSRKKKNSGRVVVGFTIEKDGSIVDAKITHSVDPDLDAEALRIVHNMPRWEPAVQYGRIVKIKFQVPIHFKLNK